MTTLTDPVAELIATFEDLAEMRGGRGDKVLAAAFEVEPWSKEFLQILACLAERLHLIGTLAEQAALYDTFRQRIATDIKALGAVVAPDILFTPWENNSAGYTVINRHLPTLMALSTAVSQTHKLPKIEDEEREEMLAAVGELRSFLQDQQLSDQDFIRQAILDGLDAFEFRLMRLRWYGWGYAQEGLRAILAANLALERGMPNAGDRPDMDAVARKTWAFAKRVYRAAGASKEAVELGSFVTGALTGGPLMDAAQAGVKLIAS